jgi:hypothetical protein
MICRDFLRFALYKSANPALAGNNTLIKELRKVFFTLLLK